MEKNLPAFLLVACAGLLGAMFLLVRTSGHAVFLPSLAREWSASVPMITCNFLVDGEHVSQTTGTGILLSKHDGTPYVLASWEVLSDGSRKADACHVDFADGRSLTVMSDGIALDEASFFAGTLSLSDSLGEPKLSADRRLCSSPPEVGNKVLVLGYPLAARAGLLTIDGIIAADDAPDGYWTSASIGGASGGVVIDANDDCYLGMTVSSDDGAPANLGRVLKWQKFAPSEN